MTGRPPGPSGAPTAPATAATWPGPLLAADGPRLADAPLDAQVAALQRALRWNPQATAVLEAAELLELPGWYLGAGSVAQTVWNQLHGRDPAAGIADFDVAYFDAGDLRARSERKVERRLCRRVGDRSVEVDATNQARVHRWYHKKFGRRIPPYRSTEHAIATWPTTASCVGVRREGGSFLVCAPFGLADLFAMVVRPNPVLVDRATYEAKSTRWAARWPQLTVLPWPR